MKVDRQYFEEQELRGRKIYKLEKLGDNLNAYTSDYHTVLFDDQDEKIAVITEDDSRVNWKPYYTAKYMYGWDGSKKTKKEFNKTLCTRAEWWMALNLIKQEFYK